MRACVRFFAEGEPAWCRAHLLEPCAALLLVLSAAAPGATCDDPASMGPAFTFANSAVSSRPQQSRPPVTTSGEPIPTDPGFLRGHGTLVRQDGALVATVAGVSAHVNKLISVRPLRARYVGEVGDVLVGRVLEMGQKRWMVDVGGRQSAMLMLSSINLPGGEQRRRTAEDQLNMRHFYVEHDLLSAEVQAFFQDGAMSLHTRSLMYGKLSGGTLVMVAPSLMKRLKQHFHTFDFGVRAIFGVNGFVWLSPRGLTSTDADADAAADADALTGDSSVNNDRERVCRARNALVALDQMCIAISPVTVCAVYRASLAAGVPPKAMLLPQVQKDICRGARACHAACDQAGS